MTAYSEMYQALTRGRPLQPTDAADLLTRLRTENTAELTTAVHAEVSREYERNDRDTEASWRRKRRDYRAFIYAVNRIRIAAGCQPIPSRQRIRSTAR